MLVFAFIDYVVLMFNEILSQNIVPSQKDDIEDQNHYKCATLIKNIIEEAENYVALCLDGKWGSGKTTIVNLLKKQFSNQKTLVYSFNAWYYEGETLRRAFLQRLYELIGCKDKEKYKLIYGRLSINNSVKKFSKLTTVISIIASIISFVLNIQNVCNCKIVSNVLIVLVFVLNFLNIIKSSKENTKTTSFEEIVYDDILFHKTFYEICNKSECKSFLVVLDDIDRMASEEQKKVFQLLQILRDGNEKNKKRFSFLLPLDSSKIRFCDSLSYFDKCFDYIIPVPEVSKNQLKEILQKNTEAMGFEDSALQEILDELLQKEDCHLTLRQILFLRNQVEVYKRFELKYDSNVSDEDYEKIIFYFCYLKFIKKTSIPDLLDINKICVPEQLNYFNKETIQKQFSALLYQRNLDLQDL